MKPCPVLVVEGKVKGFANWHEWDKWLDVHNNVCDTQILGRMFPSLLT